MQTPPDISALVEYIRSAKSATCKQRKKNTVKNVLRAAGWAEPRVQEFLRKF